MIFLGSIFKFFINIVFFINYFKFYWNKKDENCKRIVFLIIMAPSKTTFLKFENS